MKKCSICKIEKELNKFNIRSKSPLKYKAECKECQSAYRKSHFNNNKEATLAKNKEWYLKNKEYRNLKAKEHYQNTKEYSLAKKQEYRKNNRGLFAFYASSRRTAKLKRTPKWADFGRIQMYYNVCAFFNEVNGYIKYHVDHIVPMQGKTVSGLHVHNNLQVILAEDNLKKHNSWSGY